MTCNSTSWPLECDADSGQVGLELHQFAVELFPLHRAMTGAGVQSTLRAIAQRIPLKIQHVPSGQSVLDWHVPDQWEIKEAFVQHPAGHNVIELSQSNLHLVNYSVGVNRRMGWSELSSNLHSLPEHPDWIPYRTAYFRKRWGFCLSHHQRLALQEENNQDPFRVLIDAQLEPGHLSYGELLVPGQRPEEFLISTHICHPSLANDNLSGIVVATELARRLAAVPDLPISVRFLFIPATIGAIAWLALNTQKLSRIRGGLVISNLGDEGPFTYKSSRQRTALIDLVTSPLVRRQSANARLRDFTPWGYDERQFCSPGFNLPVGRLTRTPEGEYPQYHTSADDLKFIRPQSLAESLQLVASIISAFVTSLKLEHSTSSEREVSRWQRLIEGFSADRPNVDAQTQDYPKFKRQKSLVENHQDQNVASRIYLNLRPFGEPKLDRYGLYRNYGNSSDALFQQAVLWVLNLSDGANSLEAIATRSGLEPNMLYRAAQSLIDCGILGELG